MSVVSASQLPRTLPWRRGPARSRLLARFASCLLTGIQRTRRRPAHRAREAGFTLVEMLVVLVMMGLVLTAILDLLDQSGRVARSDVERDTSLNEQVGAFNRMIDELRQAYSVNCPSGGCTNNATATALDFDERVTTSGQADKRIAYNCGVPQPGATGWYECVRYEASASDTTDAVPLSSSCSSCKAAIVIQRVVNTPVFTGLTTGTSAEGTVRWISGTATIYTPTGGAFTGASVRYSSDAVFSQPFFMSQLAFGQ
jgi:prepilin-type N-terminal cleavage/methylation domain-containing protein